MSTFTIKFELPTNIVSQAGLNADNINQDVKQMFAMFLYEHKRISLSKACEISDLSQWEFFEMNRLWGIPIHYSQNDLEQDMGKLADG